MDPKTMKLYCYYFLQGENGEAWSSPNAFPIHSLVSNPSSPTVTFADVKASFPLQSTGKFHWRFRESCPQTEGSTGASFIWRDVSANTQVLPKYQGVIFAKILRLDKLPRLTSTKLRLNAKMVANAASKQQQRISPVNPGNPAAQKQHSSSSSSPVPLHSHHTLSPSTRPASYSDEPNSPKPLNPPNNTPASSPSRSRVVHKPPPPKPPSPPSPVLTRVEKLQRDMVKKQAASKVWDPIDERWVAVVDTSNNDRARSRSVSPRPPASVRATTPVPTFVPNLLDDEVTQQASLNAHAQQQLNQHLDPSEDSNSDGLEGIKGIKLGDPLATVGKSADVIAAMNARVDDMKNSQAAAVKALRDREDAKEKESEQQEEVRQRLEPKLKDWAEEYGKKRQLRALLCSLDKVLWEGSGWKPVNLGDILDGRKCVRCYQKATLKVHPDKTVHLDVEKRFLAGRVFDALSQAKTTFDDGGQM